MQARRQATGRPEDLIESTAQREALQLRAGLHNNALEQSAVPPSVTFNETA